MAFINPQKLKELFAKFEEGQEYNPGDGSAPELSEPDQKLIMDLIDEYEKMQNDPADGVSSSDYFRELLEKFKKKRDYAEKAGEYLEWDTGQATSARKQIAQSQMSAIKRKLEDYAITGELQIEAAKLAQERYKLLKKEVEELTAMENGLRKGEAMAVKITQSVFGISQSFSGPNGIIGSIEGFGKGLKSAINTTNIMMAVFTKMLEQAKAADKARESMFQKTGLTEFTSEFLEISSELASVFGPGSPAAAGEVLADLQSEMKVFKDFKDSGEIVRMANMSGKLKAFGVSTTAMGSIYQSLSKGLGMGSSEMDHTVKSLYKMGKESGMTHKETFESFAKTLPQYARFGRQAPQMFSRLAAAARVTNIKIEELMSLTEDLDTSENALKTAAKLNSLLGGSFVNGVALLAADAAGKIELIASAYQRAEAQFGVPHQRVQRAMQGYLGSVGVNAANFQKIVRGQFADFDAQVAMGDGPATDEEIKKDTEKTLDQGKRIDAAMAELIQKLNKAIYKYMPGITKSVSFLANHMYITGPALVAAGLAVSAAYFKSKFNQTVRIPQLKATVEVLKAQLTAARAAGSAKGAAGCAEVAGKAAAQIGQSAAGSVDDAAKGAMAGLGGTLAGEAAEAGAKSGGGLLAKYGSKLGEALASSKMLAALAKYPIIETIFAMGESAMVLNDPTLDVKGKARGVLEAVGGALGGYLGGLAGGWIIQLANVAPGLGVVLTPLAYMAGGMLGSYIGRLLSRSGIGHAFADNVLTPMFKDMGVGDGSMKLKLDESQMKKSGMSPNEIARAKGEYVADELSLMEAYGLEDTLTAMAPVPMRKSTFETSKDDGVLLQGLDNLKKGLIILRDTESDVTLEVGSKVYAINGGRA